MHRLPEAAAGAATFPGQAAVEGPPLAITLTAGAVASGVLKLIALKAPVFAVQMATAHVPSSVAPLGRVVVKPFVPLAPLVPLIPLAPFFPLRPLRPFLPGAPSLLNEIFRSLLLHFVALNTIRIEPPFFFTQ